MSTAPSSAEPRRLARRLGGLALAAVTGLATLTALASPAVAATTAVNIAVIGAQTYGSTTTAFAGTAANGAGITGTITCTGLTTAPIGSTLAAGTYAIDPTTCSGAHFSNPAFTLGSYTATATSYTVAKASLSLTADSLTKTYGAANPALTYTVAGYVNGDTSAVLSGAPLLATSATTTSAAGSYVIQIAVNSLRASNYSFAATNGTLTVNPAPVTITTSGAQVYGSAAGWAGTTGVSGLTVSGLSCATVNGGTAVSASLPFGAYTIDGSSCSGGVLSSANYSIAGYSNGAFSVLKRGLTVTADPQTRVFGVANPTLTYTVTGFAPGEDASVLSGATVLSTTAVTTSDVGSYPISVTPGSLRDSNYSFTYVSGSLSVTPAPTTVTVTGAQNYGSSSVGFAGTSSVKGVTISGVTCTTVNGGTAITSSLPAGTYTIDGSSCSGGVTSTGDYAISSYTGGTFSVFRVSLTFTADSQTRVFGIANPTLTYTVTGFVNGDDASVLSGTPALATNAVPASDVGSYPIGIGTGTLQASNNYKYVFVNGTLSVTPAPLTVTVTGAQNYGSSSVGFTGTSSVKGVTVTGVSCTTVNGGTAIAPTLNFGGYPIDGSSCSGGQLSTPDYAISSYTGGAFNVFKVALTITPDNASRAFGKANPAFTYSVSGYVNGDTSAAYTGAPALTTTATSASGTGTYPITATAGSLKSTNYFFTFGQGTLTVTAQPVVVNSTGAQNYGSSAVGIASTTSVSGLTVSGVTCTGLTNGSTISASLNASTYTIDPATCSGGTLSNSNYSIGSYTGGNYIVFRIPLKATANDLSKVYGAANPTFTTSYSGFANGDTASVVSGAATFSTTATASSAVGTYPITIGAGTLHASNYYFTLANGTLTVTPATLTVTANNASRDYGSANPTFAATITGYVNGDDSSVVSGAPTFSTTATTSSDPGTFPITPALGTLSATNYTFAFVPGTLTVNKAAPTLTLTPTLYSYVSGTLTYGTSKTPIVGATLTFTINVKAATLLCTAVTNSSGTATCTPSLANHLTSVLDGYNGAYAGSTDFTTATATTL